MSSRIRQLLAHLNVKTAAKTLIIPFSFILPILTLYIFDPNSFQYTWKGRAPYLFFLWLFFLELVLAWGKLPKNQITPLRWERILAAGTIMIVSTAYVICISKFEFSVREIIELGKILRLPSWFLASYWPLLIEYLIFTAFFTAYIWNTHGIDELRCRRTLTTATAMAVPTAYVICVSKFGLSSEIIELGKIFGLSAHFLHSHWPLSLEYLILTAFFTTSLLFLYKVDGLKRFPVSLFFIGAIGTFYLIDTFYPFGTLTILQAFVPLTASFVGLILSWLGYEVAILSRLGRPEDYTYLRIAGGHSSFEVAIYWPCAGLHSLFIYTFVILLFIKDIKISPKTKLAYFLIGAFGTFIVNTLRISSICIIGINAGANAAQMFHTYYGELFFIGWILVYPLAIVYTPKIWTKLSPLRIKLKTTVNEKIINPLRARIKKD